MAKWRDLQKSPTREIGIGNVDTGVSEKVSNRMPIDAHDRVYVCPDCGEKKSSNIIDRRADFLECRTCGYTNDTMYWYKEPVKYSKPRGRRGVFVHHPSPDE